MTQGQEAQEKIRRIIEEKEKEINFWEKIEKIPAEMLLSVYSEYIIVNNRTWQIKYDHLTNYESRHDSSKLEHISKSFTIYLSSISGETMWEYMSLVEKISKLIHSDESLYSRLIELMENKLQEIIESNTKITPSKSHSQWKEFSLWNMANQNLMINKWEYDAFFDENHFGLNGCFEFYFKLDAKNSELRRDGVGRGFASFKLNYNESENKISLAPEEVEIKFSSA